MRAAILIVSWEGEQVLPACLTSLAPHLNNSITLLIVDNGSTDGTVRIIRDNAPTARLIENRTNLGFGGGVNVGLKALLEDDRAELVILLNQDTVVAPAGLTPLLDAFRDAKVGGAGCKLLYPDGITIQHAGTHLEYPRALAHHVGWHELDQGQYDQQREADYVTGAAFALRMSALRQVGLFDEGYNPGYYEDCDMCWRLRRAGFCVVYVGAASLVHRESSSFRDAVKRSGLYNRNRLRLVLKTYSSMAFRVDFLPAERRFVDQHATGDEARALRWAYLHALIMLPSTLAARQDLRPDDPLNRTSVSRALILLRRAIGERERAGLESIGRPAYSSSQRKNRT